MPRKAGPGPRKPGQMKTPALPRMTAVRLKKAKKLKTSSAAWLTRQLNDPYVAAAKKDGWRSRAAYKLIQLDEKFSLLRPGLRVVDLGAAPGGWSQVVAQKIFGKKNKTGWGKLVALDILPLEGIPGAIILHQDFMEESAPDNLKKALGGETDLVLSDMAPPTTGHNKTDHLRIMGLAEAAYAFAREILAPEGAFVCKLFQGGAEKNLLDQLRRDFKTVKHAKPPASRSESAETYVVALGFRG